MNRTIQVQSNINQFTSVGGPHAHTKFDWIDYNLWWIRIPIRICADECDEYSYALINIFTISSMVAFVLRFLQHAQRALLKLTGCTLPTHLPPSPPSRYTVASPRSLSAAPLRSVLWQQVHNASCPTKLLSYAKRICATIQRQHSARERKREIGRRTIVVRSSDNRWMIVDATPWHSESPAFPAPQPRVKKLAHRAAAAPSGTF